MHIPGTGGEGGLAPEQDEVGDVQHIAGTGEERLEGVVMLVRGIPNWRRSLIHEAG